MNGTKTFRVFGEPVEVLVSGEMTGGLSATIAQVSPPGGGPPPHHHTREDEVFVVMEGEYELLQNGAWHRVEVGRPIHGGRGSVHTFRNVGQTDGKMLIFITPAGLEKYLEEISVLSMPQDAGRLKEISDRYGITFA